jgi:histidyl-tRNA synthetase
MDPRFASSNPAKDAFLRAIIIRSMTSFGEEVKLSVPRRKILRHVKDSTGMKKDTS